MSLQDILSNGSNPPPWSRLRVASIFSNETIAGGDFDVTGDFDVQGSSHFTGPVVMDSSLNVALASTFQGNSHFTNPVVMDSTLNVALAATFQDDSQFSGPVVMDSSLDVALASRFRNDLQIEGDINGVGAVFAEDIRCRDLSATRDLTTATLTVSGLGKFDAQCQCVAGVNIGNILNVDNTIDHYYTRRYPAITVTNADEVATIRYCRVGNVVTISVVATVTANAGFIANGVANMHLATADYPDIAAAITTDLAGRSMHFPGLIQIAGAGGLFQPGGITLATDGVITMFECNSDGKISTGNTFFNFSICYSVI